MTSRSSHLKETSLSKKALPLFFTGLILSTFVGGAIRAFFSPRQIEVWVSETLEKENPAFDLSFSSGRLSLSKNSFPRLGLVFHQVHLQPKDFCKLNAELFIEQLYLPIQIADFLKGKLRFRHIEADGAELNLGVGNCLNAAAAAAAAEATTSDATTSSLEGAVEPEQGWDRKLTQLLEQKAWLEFFRERWRKEMINTAERTRGLRISELKVREAEKPVLTLRAVDVDTSSPDKFELSAIADFHRLQGFVDSFSPTRIQLEADADVLRLKVFQQIREGHLDFKSEILLNSLFFTSNLELSHIPSRPLFDAVVKNGWSKNNLNWPRQSWLSGRLQLSGDLKHPLETQFTFKDWKFEGDLGKISLVNSELRPFNKKAWDKPVKIELSTLKMDPTFNLLEYHKLKGLFHSFGTFRGQLVIKDPETFDLVGEWDELELKFSNANVRQMQKFSFDSKLSRQAGRWSGEIDKVDVEAGRFKGLVSFNFDEKTWSGPIQIKIEELLLSEPVQQLMFNGRGSPMEIYGQARFSQGQIEDGELALGLEKIDGADWQAKVLKLTAKLKNQIVESKVGLKDLSISTSHSYFGHVQPLYLDPEFRSKLGDDEIRWQNVRGKLQIKNSTLSWQKASAKDVKNNVMFASEGSWNTTHGFNGWVSVDFPLYKLLKWNLSGTRQSPRLEPSANMLRELEKRNPSLDVKALLPAKVSKAEGF